MGQAPEGDPKACAVGVRLRGMAHSAGEQGTLKLDMAHWEFIPFWINDSGELQLAREKHTTLNAKGETLLSSRMFARSARERRCLMLSSGFYEWRHYRGKAYPYFIKLKDKDLFLYRRYLAILDRQNQRRAPDYLCTGYHQGQRVDGQSAQ